MIVKRGPQLVQLVNGYRWRRLAGSRRSSRQFGQVAMSGSTSAVFSPTLRRPIAIASPHRALLKDCPRVTVQRGGALLEASATWAAAHAVRKLALGVFPENRRAVGFYERHGCVREGLRRAQYERAGRYHDEVLMARFLAPVS